MVRSDSKTDASATIATSTIAVHHDEHNSESEFTDTEDILMQPHLGQSVGVKLSRRIPGARIPVPVETQWIPNFSLSFLRLYFSAFFFKVYNHVGSAHTPILINQSFPFPFHLAVFDGSMLSRRRSTRRKSTRGKSTRIMLYTPERISR